MKSVKEWLVGRGNRIPYHMFDLAQLGVEAKSAHTMERIYHKAHAHAWDGKEVLAALIEEHGAPHLPDDVRRALGRVFSIILWGELAAWKISAQLADELEPLSAKLAATSQAFDEARHFYVMHDYLEALGGLPERMDYGAAKLLNSVMNADHIAKKLLGMQLMVEPIALTLFHVVKRLDVEPVLTHLLPYYEQDEARHVALGIQYLPSILARMNQRELMSTWLFQLKLITFEVWSNRGLAEDFALLGLDPRELLQVGKGKQLRALEMLNEAKGQDGHAWQAEVLGRWADTMVELTLPRRASNDPIAVRLRRAFDAARGRVPQQAVELTPDVTPEQVPLIRGLGERQRRAAAPRRRA